MDTVIRIKKLLRNSLNLGDRADRLTPASGLMGSMAEFDSMAVVNVITAMEEEFGIAVDDDELTADLFATVGSLADFLDRKLSG
jgi:acyl carrier protein